MNELEDWRRPWHRRCRDYEARLREYVAELEAEVKQREDLEQLVGMMQAQFERRDQQERGANIPVAVRTKTELVRLGLTWLHRDHPRP